MNYVDRKRTAETDSWQSVKVSWMLHELFLIRVKADKVWICKKKKEKKVYHVL
jgi:hypothetical protein